MKRLEGRHAVITGAGSGIGRAIAIRFAQEGARVSVVDINMERAGQVKAEITAAGGIACTVHCDVSKYENMLQAIDEARSNFGPVDIMVNNAGGAIVAGTQSYDYSGTPIDYIQRIIDVNHMGALWGCRAVAEEMKKRHKGKIINFSSVRGINGGKGNVTYAAAKGAIISLTKSLALEMGGYGVTVNAIAPGAIASRSGPAACKTVFGHPGRCEDVAALAAYIASDEADFMTGSNVVLDGGRICACLGD